MKDFFKKQWSIPVIIIGLMVLVCLFNILILTISLASPFDESIWAFSNQVPSDEVVPIFAFLLKLMFFISIGLIIYAGASLLLKQENKALISGIVYTVIFETLFLVFQIIFKCMSGFQIFLILFSFVIAVGMGFLYAYREKIFGVESESKTKELDKKIFLTKIPITVLVIDIIAMFILILTFLIPLYSIKIGEDNYSMIMINVILAAETDIGVIISFFVSLVLTLVTLFNFYNCISLYFYNRASFIKKSKEFIIIVFTIVLLFFITGLAMSVFHTLMGSETSTKAYIPSLFMGVLAIILSINIGQYRVHDVPDQSEEKDKFFRIEPLIYVILLTIITGLTLFLNVIKIELSSGEYSDYVTLTGLNILQDYANLEPGYRFIAFILVVMLIASSVGLIITISSYFSKYRYFNRIVKAVAGLNIFFIFMLSVSGYYFQIGHKIDKAVVLDIFNYYEIAVPSYVSNFEYYIRTDAIYLLVAAVIILVVMFLRKAFDRDELSLTDMSLGALQGLGGGSSTSTLKMDEQGLVDFDPCVAFTELDKKIPYFKNDLEMRQTYKTKNATLGGLVYFIIEYARNSRLHLSYTREDIATFVAGLGASKLSILQGMSGTGKTSLPKIFAEAIFANCEIVEVESSWKDKNELLGYYNEFSMKYTPKKFTLALYKAALNPNIFTFILLDEINLSRIEYYFSDFISLMEHEESERKLKFSNVKLTRKENGKEIEYEALENGHTLKVSPNVWFVGTANLDETTFAISDKVYDRAQTMNFIRRASKVRNYTNPIPQEFYDYETINNLLEVAKANGVFDAESNELIQNIEMLLAPYNISFGNRVLKQIEDFVNIYKACFPQENVENEAIEKILLSKVVAKLEFKTIDDKEGLQIEFEKLKLYRCADFIRRLDNE